MIDAKYTLAKMYGRMPGYEPDALSDEQFKRKQALCVEVLAVLDKIVPGRMRKRGKNNMFFKKNREKLSPFLHSAVKVGFF